MIYTTEGTWYMGHDEKKKKILATNVVIIVRKKFHVGK